MTMTETQPQTQLATRRYEPRAPVGNAGGLKSLLEASRNSIMQALPKHVTPERLIKTMLVAANRTPKLFDCTQSSVLECINRAAELGLDLSGTLGEAYPVPYGNVCTLIIGYRGLEKLAWQSNEISSIDAEVVYENDTFKFKKGTEVTVEWSPCMTGDRGKPVGAYACIAMKNGGKLARFLPVSEINHRRDVSRAGKSGPWVDWWDEMARKTVLRLVLKDAPLSTEKFVGAMEHDAQDTDFNQVVEAQTQHRGTAALVDKLHARGNGGARHPDGSLIELPDTQLSDEEAERVLREKSNGQPSSPAPAAGIPPAEDPAPPLAEDQPGAGDDVQQDEQQEIDRIDVTGSRGNVVSFPAKPTPAARKDVKQLDDLIQHVKPANVAMPTARNAFKKRCVPDGWHMLPAGEQDVLYGALLSGAVNWSA